MNISNGNLTGYLFFAFILIVSWGCGGGGIITRDIQIQTDSALWDVEVDNSDVWSIDTIEDISDTELRDIADDVKDISEDIFDAGISDALDDVANDVCIPNCVNKYCGDDGCGGSCGSCGANATCINNECACNKGFGNCNNNWMDGCETAGYVKHIWSRNFGGRGDDISTSISTDKLDNVYIGGYFGSESINFGGGEITHAGESGSQALFLAKFDSNGGYMWSKGFGGFGVDTLSSIKIDNQDNLYITGHFESPYINFGGGDLKNQSDKMDSRDWFCDDIFLAKFDSNGNYIWSKKFGGSKYDRSNSVAVDSGGNVFITGESNSSYIDFGGGAISNCATDFCTGAFLAKFDSNGNHIWSKIYKGQHESEYVWSKSMSVDSIGNVYICGFTDALVNFGCGNISNNGMHDIFIAKFDRNGVCQWSKSFGGNKEDRCRVIVTDKAGFVYIAGSFESYTMNIGDFSLRNVSEGCPDNCSGEIFIAKLDSNGNPIWAKAFDGGEITSLTTDNQNNLVATGGFGSKGINFDGNELKNSGYFGADIFIAVFDNGGNHKWSMSFGGENCDESNSVSVDNSNNILITGYYISSNLNLGGCLISNAGGKDIFIAKYAP